MDIHEHIALRIAKERLEDAVRSAEQMRALRLTRARTSARIRLGRVLVRLGHWMLGQPSPVPPSPCELR